MDVLSQYCEDPRLEMRSQRLWVVGTGKASATPNRKRPVARVR